MTNREANLIFDRDYAPQIGRDDKPALRTAWNDWTDSLHRDGVITDRQRENWTYPTKYNSK